MLVEFDLGRNRLIELPIYKANGKTLSDYPLHFLVQISETKPMLIPEQSKNIVEPIPPGFADGSRLDPQTGYGDTASGDIHCVRMYIRGGW